MEKPREKVFFRKDSLPNVPKTIEKEKPRPRSRSVYTSKSHNSDGSGSNRELKQYDIYPWISRAISKNLYVEEYNHDVWHEDSAMGGPSVTPHGIITLRLHDRVRVDISLDRAIRVVNMRSGIVLSLSSSGSSAALIHPNGRVYQYGSRVEILANDAQGNNKYAKMWYKGVSFTSDQCALVYLVDSAGTRTTTDTFSDLSGDFSLTVFYSDSQYSDPSMGGPNLISEAVSLLHSSSFWITDDGTDNWIINNVRISQTADGLVRKQVAIIAMTAVGSVLFVTFITIGVSSSYTVDSKELLLVHVISRHGARTPVDTYPKDPYINTTFYPAGWGQLTNLLLVRKMCAQYDIEFRKLMSSPMVQERLRMNKELFEYLEEWTGNSINTFDDVQDLYSTLYAEESFNLTLPSWTINIFPDKLYELTSLSFHLRAYNDILIKLKGGVLLKKIIDDWASKKDGTIKPDGRRMFVYGGHDSTIANLLSALKIFKPHVPDYTSTIILEFSRDRFTGEYGIEVFYKMSVHHELQKMRIPNCDSFCLLKDFLRVTADVVPENWEKECHTDDPDFIPSEPIGP
ncbi:acid phosphatase-related [Holotrichia oblita]|uniref:Acid phosphatase-related n=1 Tax=Holotrichia oblita TaxID=644536 RepID=A0ACB9SIN3_HOLOL|nr:acid phosphatase-related [Holotrichia oblita]